MLSGALLGACTVALLAAPGKEVMAEQLGDDEFAIDFGEGPLGLDLIEVGAEHRSHPTRPITPFPALTLSVPQSCYVITIGGSYTSGDWKNGLPAL